MRLAEIDGDIVLNVIVVDTGDIPDWCADWPECPDGGPGWLYRDGMFIPPTTAPVEI